MTQTYTLLHVLISLIAIFFVVKSGEIEIVRPSGGSDMVITTHGRSQFTGEVNMLSGSHRQSPNVSRTDQDIDVQTASRHRSGALQFVNAFVAAPEPSRRALKRLFARRERLRRVSSQRGYALFRFW